MNKDIRKLINSLQEYGAVAPNNPTDPDIESAYRQGWIDGLEEFKKQLTNNK